MLLKKFKFFATMLDLSALGLANMPDLTNIKERKKRKQSITSGNPTIICLHTPHHVKKGTIVHPIRRQMARFDHRKASYAPSIST
jgi:hypothetical protein